MASEGNIKHETNGEKETFATPVREREVSSGRKYSREKYSGLLKSGSQRGLNSDRKPVTLENCLRELKDIKKTIKDLK